MLAGNTFPTISRRSSAPTRATQDVGPVLSARRGCLDDNRRRKGHCYATVRLTVLLWYSPRSALGHGCRGDHAPLPWGSPRPRQAQGDARGGGLYNQPVARWRDVEGKTEGANA